MISGCAESRDQSLNSGGNTDERFALSICCSGFFRDKPGSIEIIAENAMHKETAVPWIKLRKPK